MLRERKCEPSTVLTLVLSTLLVAGCSGNFASATVAEHATSDENENGIDSSDTPVSTLAAVSAAASMLTPTGPLAPDQTLTPTGSFVSAQSPAPTPTDPFVSAQALAPSALGSNASQPSLGAAVQVVSDELCEGFVSDARSVEIPSLQKPDFMDAYIDPAFGSRVVRITNSSPGEVNKPAYSTMQAWNADETYLLLYRTGTTNSGHTLLDGHTYEFIQNLDFTPADIEEVYWSHADPDALFYISKRIDDYGKLNQFNVSTNRSTVIADFGVYCGDGLPSGGNDVHMQSLNDDLFGFSCQQDDGHHIMLSYTPSTGSIVSAPIGIGSDWSEWSAPMPTPSANGFWHQGYVIDNDLQQVVHQLDMATPVEHASIGMTHNGQDAYYQVGFNVSPNDCDGDLYKGVGHLVEHNMSTGDCRNIVSEEQGYPYPTSGTHISAQAYLKPERVVVSSIGKLEQFGHFTNSVPAPALLSEVYVAQTSPTDTKVCRLAHHRSYGKSAVNGGYAAYFGEPHATISPKGTRIVFGSDWYDSGSVDSFVIELPDYIRP